MTRFGLTLPIFGELADPVTVAGLAREAEQAGFDGVFVWDHVLYRRDPNGPQPHGRADLAVADPWVTLAAMAVVTSHVRLGAMVTPLARRRSQVLARQVTTLDRLSEGRLVVGVGLGGDDYGEFSVFDDEADARTRGVMLDQRLDLVRELWSGAVVASDRTHAPAHDVQFMPTPLQRPHPPIWVAGRWPHRAPRRRAAHADGWFPIDLPGPDALAQGVAVMTEHRGNVEGYDVVANGAPDTDPGPWLDAGATWWLTTFTPWDVTAARVRAVIDGGPARA